MLQFVNLYEYMRWLREDVVRYKANNLAMWKVLSKIDPNLFKQSSEYYIEQKEQKDNIEFCL